MGVKPTLEDVVESQRAAWRIIARMERTETSETEAGEGILVELRNVIQVSPESRAEATQAETTPAAMLASLTRRFP